MITVPAGVRIHLALGFTDMRKGMDGLSLLVQQVLRQDPFSGHLFVFRGRSASLVKILMYDQNGLCLFAKRLDQGRFTWPATQPNADGSVSVTLSPAQLSMLLEGLEWRTPVRTWVPALAG
ncbi:MULTISPECIES: IS66 family insertion sequence element accessory protein TnpB [Roseomonas]|uniref:IS66 family insertion sequence element accessory protein TnpB n=1 Tax=Roseomonas TaxID=125216 RepID=UPI0011A2C735|nr:MULTISPECIES: IS66 family insertion sequence element accessory protein TnpB [Roseomonas]QET91591.1 IS66 family insertion sequence element accessory protein TnpB [Roseomonas mucosa]